MTSIPDRFRDAYGRHVISDARVQDRLFKLYRFSRRRIAGARALVGTLQARGGVPTNVYHATIQKTGSHWFKAIFADSRVRRYSKLWSYPGHRYEWDEFHKRFPRHHFVPGLFISYGQYEEILKPPDHRTFYVMRDPRDVVISWYHSMRDTHRLTGKVAKHRSILQSTSLEEGISYSIETLAYTFSFMRTWAVAGPDDPAVLMTHFEDLVARPFEGFRQIMDHCRIPIPDGELRGVLETYTKARMREIDEEERSFLRKRSLSDKSHYRPQASSWQEAFTPEHIDLFRRINGDLLERLGYADFALADG